MARSYREDVEVWDDDEYGSQYLLEANNGNFKFSRYHYNPKHDSYEDTWDFLSLDEEYDDEEDEEMALWRGIKKEN